MKTVISAKLISCLLMATLFASLLGFGAAAKNETITECVNLVNVSKNESGSGYYWANKYDTLTLTDMTIDTADDYGLRLPADATVILEGDNYISAAKAAVVCAGTTSFKGTGTLTIVSDGMGIFVNCSNSRKTVMIVGGTYTITAGTDGIRSDSVPFSIADCKIDMTVGGYAATAYTLAINGAELSANGAFNAINSLTVTDSDITAEAGSPVFSSEKGTVTLNKMSYKVGSSLSSLTEADEYGNETAVATVGTVAHYTRSVLFGGDVHVWVDYLIGAGVLIILGGVIFWKVYSQKKRDERKKAEIEAIRAAQSPAKAAAKK